MKMTWKIPLPFHSKNVLTLRKKMLIKISTEHFFVLHCQKNTLKNKLNFHQHLEQGWATLFVSRASLETKFVCEGQYKNPMDLFDLIFKRKWVFGCSFSKKEHFKRHFLCFINLKKCSRAKLRCLGRAACGPRAGRCPGLT